MLSTNTAPSTEPPLSGDASVLSGADLLDIFAQGITRHYARQLVEARASGSDAEVIRVLNCIQANHPDPAAVGRAAVQLTLQRP